MMIQSKELEELYDKAKDPNSTPEEREEAKKKFLELWDEIYEAFPFA